MVEAKPISSSMVGGCNWLKKVLTYLTDTSFPRLFIGHFDMPLKGEWKSRKGKGGRDSPNTPTFGVRHPSVYFLSAMLEHFCECYYDLCSSIMCVVLGSIIPLRSKFKRTTNMIDWSMCLPYYFFIFHCSCDTIRSLYRQISIWGKPLMASLWKQQYEFGYRWFFFYLHDIYHIFYPYLFYSGLWYVMRSYGKEYITTSLICESQRIVAC